EHPEYRPTLVDLDEKEICAEALLDEIAADGEETEIALRNGQRFGLRIEPVPENALPPRRRRFDAATRLPPFRVSMSAPGLIENLSLVAMSPTEPRPGEVAIEVRAVGLNFRDVMAATGLLPAAAESEPAWQRLGFECAGVVATVGEGVDAHLIGRRVGAMGPGCLASHVAVAADRIFPLSSRQSFALAAASPGGPGRVRDRALRAGDARTPQGGRARADPRGGRRRRPGRRRHRAGGGSGSPGDRRQPGETAAPPQARRRARIRLALAQLRRR